MTLQERETGGGIAVIVVNYGTPDLAIEAVESVLSREHGGRHVEVHLVDNASPGDDAAHFAEAHEARGWDARVTLHPETENHGFGRGNNVVLKALAARDTPPDYVFLLNPDARLNNEALDILASVLDAHPEVGFAGAAISTSSGVPASAAFRFPTPFGEFVRQVNFGPIVRLLRHRVISLPPAHEQGPVDWVSGAAMMMRLEAGRALDFFDPDYFLYYEEVDLMHRGHRAGWRTWYVPQARAVHSEGTATGIKRGHRPRRPAYWYRSWRTYFRKNYGVAGLWIAALSWMAGATANHVLSYLPGRDVSVPRRFFGDFTALVLRPMVGLREGRA